MLCGFHSCLCGLLQSYRVLTRSSTLPGWSWVSPPWIKSLGSDMVLTVPVPNAPQEGQCCVDASPCPMARSTSTTLLSPSTQQHRQCHTSPQLPTGARRQCGAGGNVDAKPVSSYSLSISALSSQQALQQESNGGLRAVTILGVTGYFRAGKIINLCLQNSVPNCS